MVDGDGSAEVGSMFKDDNTKKSMSKQINYGFEQLVKEYEENVSELARIETLQKVMKHNKDLQRYEHHQRRTQKS